MIHIDIYIYKYICMQIHVLVFTSLFCALNTESVSSGE